MPSVLMKRTRRKTRVPARRIAEKLEIWGRYREPVGHKFYGKYKEEGEWKHFEFSVVTSRRMKKRAMYFWVRTTYSRMKFEKRLPPRHYYHTYDGFMYLHGLEWDKVEEVIPDYKHTAT